MPNFGFRRRAILAFDIHSFTVKTGLTYGELVRHMNDYWGIFVGTVWTVDEHR